MPSEEVLKRMTPLRITKRRFNRYCGGLTSWGLSVVAMFLLGAVLLVGIKLIINNRDPYDSHSIDLWSAIGERVTKYHSYDRALSDALLHFWKSEDVDSLIDLGAGLGLYSRDSIAADIFTSCYDGHPETFQVTEGRCAMVDLLKPMNFSRSDWVFSLEIAEHIPRGFEDAFIANLDRVNKKGMVISWAGDTDEGQGHVNRHENSYIIKKIEKLGYKIDMEEQTILRTAAKKSYFKNSIMVFRNTKKEGKGIFHFLFG